MARGSITTTDLVMLSGRSAAVRMLLVFFALLTIAFAVIAIRWQIGNMLASLTQAADLNAAEIGNLAVAWAPGDPSTHALVASAADFNGAIDELEQSVRRAPNDYRWRIELGRAYEQAERSSDAEVQFRRGVELAPNLSLARWTLGNYLLRANRTDEAFAELRLAAEANQSYRDEVFSLLWDYSNRDAGRLQKLAGDNPDLVGRLSYFFAARGYAGDALNCWNRLPSMARSPEIARSIALGLFEKRFFRESLAFSRDYGAETGSSPNAITNPSFEDPLISEENLFGWRINRSDPKFEVSPDNRVRKDGTRGIRGTFKGPLKAGFANVFQTIVIDPGARYRISAWVRTENLRSAGMPLLEVIDPADASRLGVSKTFLPGSNDWAEYTADFTAPAGASAVTIRTVRADCGEDCPITGIFWYDNFRLEKL